jgi:hypothetical protein
MRVEFVYAPNCTTYKKALHVLETVIAEERLPIAIEMIEQNGSHVPVVRINGTELGEPAHEFEGDPCFLSSSSALVGRGIPCAEQLRSHLSRQWSELTIPA